MANKKFKLGCNILWIYYILVVVGLMVVTFGCSSKSGQLANTPNEKVVILDSYPPVANQKINTNSNPMIYKYRVKRITEGVIDVIYEYNKFESGDTIYHRFVTR